MRSYGEHLEGQRNIPRATEYRRKRERLQRDYSDSSSEDGKWRVSNIFIFLTLFTLWYNF